VADPRSKQFKLHQYDWEPRNPDAFRRYFASQLRQYGDDEYTVGSARELGYVNILPNSIIDIIIDEELVEYRKDPNEPVRNISPWVGLKHVNKTEPRIE
jgi:hypothetical protein